jgi:hypothetical protein
LSIVLFPQSRTVHMSSSGLREQHNRQLNICWREQCICLHLDWESNTIDNGISVGRNQMKTYVLLLPTDIQLSIVLFPQSRWRHEYCCFQQIFNCLLCCFLNPEQYICLHLDWENNTIDNWISVGGNSAYVFIWIEETIQ